MTVSVRDTVDKILLLIDPLGYTAEQFCMAAKDQPVPNIEQHWLSLAESGHLAVFRAGYEDGKTGEFTHFSTPWIYDAQKESVAEMCVDVLQSAFPHDEMRPRHWGVAAERCIAAGQFPGMTRPVVLYRWVEALRQDKLRVEFTHVDKSPYESQVDVTIKDA